MESDIIVSTIKTLGTSLLTLTGIGLITIQYVKTKLGIDDKKAEIFSLVVGFILSGLVAWVWVDGLAYALELGQWVGVGLFVLIGTIGPSGGYKLINSFAGTTGL